MWLRYQTLKDSRNHNMLNINISDIGLIMAPLCLLLFLLQGEFKMSSLAGG